MPITSKATGQDEIEKNLAALEQRINAAVEKGLHLAGLHLQGKSQKEAPAEYGNLRNSAYTSKTGTGLQTKIEVGYTAPYAGFVHEKVDMVLKGKPRPSGLGTYWSPAGAKAKFLEDPAREEMPAMQKIITNQVRKAVNTRNPAQAKEPVKVVNNVDMEVINREVKKALSR
jgi:hypothetical protein